ncbi:hypothetical protein ACH4S8_37190 [Streptomyces sp. NPDC021080]|uniref:hypothetical protein n=1 Tax=Streptomyces sp. NPDC021080 TaxID=3365110 RepID=UPI0037A9D574
MKTLVRHVPTPADVTEALTGAVRPMSSGDIIYSIAMEHAPVSPSSVEEAREAVSAYTLNIVLGEMVADGRVVARTGREWYGHRLQRAGSRKRLMGTVFYVLRETADAWAVEDLKEAEKRLEAKAATLATAALIAAHHGEYTALYADMLAKVIAGESQ